MTTFTSSLPNFTLTFSIPVIALVFVLILLIYFIVLPFKKVNSYKREGVTTFFFPVLGFFAYLQKNFKTKDDMMAGIKENGRKPSKYLATHVNNTPFILLQDSKYIKELLLNPSNYTKTYVIDVLKLIAGNGLVAIEGENWKRHKKIISTCFNFEFLKANLPIMQNTAREYLKKVSPEEYDNYSVGKNMQSITGEVFGRIFFGRNLTNYTFEGKTMTLGLGDLALEFGETCLDPLVVFLGPKAFNIPFIPKYRILLQRAKNFRQLCLKVINDRRSMPYTKSNDLLALLLATQESPDVENRFSDEEIVDEFITLVIAGMDTTSQFISMTLYNLAKYPQYVSQLDTERETGYNREQQVTTDTLNKMEVLHSVLKETLRFYMPSAFPFMRKAVVDHDILDLKVKKGDLINCAFLAPAHDQRNFENPEQFNPARWTNGETKIDPYAFTPFSVGPRNCIGQHLAMMEAKVIVSEFLERFEFALKDGYKLRMMSTFMYEPEEKIFFSSRPKLVKGSK